MLGRLNLDKLVSAFIFFAKHRRLKISIYLGRRRSTCGRLLGKVSVTLDLADTESRATLFKSGWVPFGKLAMASAWRCCTSPSARSPTPGSSSSSNASPNAVPRSSRSRATTDRKERGEERLTYIPGIPSIQLSSLPNLFSSTKNDEVLKKALEAVASARRSQCLLFTSFYELDSRVIDSLKSEFPFPVYTVGPSIPYMALCHEPLQKVIDQNHLDCNAWLNLQPQSSVLYVSLGSFISVSGQQMHELAMGLRDSGTRFLWIARAGVAELQELCGENGLVVPWCDQLTVLCHPSVGGFLTHCGFNSTMEGVFAGVPMLTFPLAWDQPPNAKLIVEDWKIGLYLKKAGGESVVLSAEIRQAVNRLMDLDESKELRRRAREMQEACKRAIEKGGLSDTDLCAFVEEIVNGHRKQTC